jgi:PII-like signaling protein
MSLVIGFCGMELPRDAVLLRIFVEEADEHDGQPLFRKIVLKPNK